MCAGQPLRFTYCVVISAALACGSPSKPIATSAPSAMVSKRSVLEHVPASTPYVWAQLDPLPEDYVDSLFENADKYRRVFIELRRVREQHPDIMDDLDPATRIALAIIGELDGKVSRRGMRELGLDLRGRAVIYGHGIWPVFRLEIADGAKLRATALRLAEQLEGQIPTLRHRDRQLWHAGAHLDGDNIDVVVDISDSELVVALTPSGSQQAEFLDELFATRPKGPSLAESGTLAALSQRYQLGAAGSAGFVDLVHLAELSATVIPDVGPECASELRALARTTGRWVFGTSELSPKAVSGKLVVETSEELHAALERSRASVPALALAIAKRQAFALGLGLDVRSFAEYATVALRQLEKRRFSCKPLHEIGPLAARMERSLIELLRSPAKALLGAQLLISHIEISTGLPTSLDAALFLGSREPPRIVELLSELIPSLRGKTIEPGAAAQPLEVPGASTLPFFRHVFIAAGQGGLAISVGENGKKLLGLVDQEPAGGMPLFVMHSTGKFWRTITRITGGGMAEAMNDFDSKLGKAMAELEQDDYESFSVEARVIPAGVSVDFLVAYPNKR